MEYYWWIHDITKKESTEPNNITSDPTPDKPTTKKSSISGHSFKSLLTGSQSAQLLQNKVESKQTNTEEEEEKKMEWWVSMPKIELHAHLNGSIRDSTLLYALIHTPPPYFSYFFLNVFLGSKYYILFCVSLCEVFFGCFITKWLKEERRKEVDFKFKDFIFNVSFLNC